MTGFEYYDYIGTDYPDAKETVLNDEELVRILRSAEKSIRANCGELRRFSSPDAREAILDFIKEGGIFEITCGNWLYGDKNKMNPLLNDLSQEGLLGNGANCFYTSSNSLEQTFYGIVHQIIIDDGRYIFIEKPHGDGVKTNQVGKLIENEYELGEVSKNITSPFFKYVAIQTANDESVINNTTREGDLECPNRNSFFEFQTEEQFNERVMTGIN
jgi:hypothetical protein